MQTMEEVASTCIDFAHYDQKKKQLTVRFIDQDPRRIYRYFNVPISVWKKLNALNETGRVGAYFNATIVQHPEKYPFEELTVRSFRQLKKSKKPKT